MSLLVLREFLNLWLKGLNIGVSGFQEFEKLLKHKFFQEMYK
jgi:hypothetical protein